MFLTKQTSAVAMSRPSLDFGMSRINEAYLMLQIAEQDATITAMNEEFQIISEAEESSGKSKRLETIKAFFAKLFEAMKNAFSKVSKFFKDLYAKIAGWLKAKYASIDAYVKKLMAKGSEEVDDILDLTAETTGTTQMLAELKKTQDSLAGETDKAKVEAAKKSIAEIEAEMKKVFADAPKKAAEMKKAKAATVAGKIKALKAQISDAEKSLKVVTAEQPKLEAELKAKQSKFEADVKKAVEGGNETTYSEEAKAELDALKARADAVKSQVEGLQRLIVRLNSAISNHQAKNGGKAVVKESDDEMEELEEDDDVQDPEELSEDSDEDEEEEELDEAVSLSSLYKLS